MRRFAVSCRFVLCAIMITFGSAAPPAAAEEGSVSLLDAVTKGSFSLDLNYRFEDVDQDGFDDRGQASTLRTTAGYRSMWWKGFEAYLEFEDVHDVGWSSDHNNTGAASLWNGVSDRPVIADPAGTEINQAYIGWKPITSLPFRLGLQEIVIDNARFVGNVGWRQNHQSFEAARVAFEGVDKLVIRYSYISRQHTITGASLPMSTSHLGAAYTFDGIGTLSAYGLMLDYDDEAQRQLNTTTYGAFFDGRAKLSERLGLVYRLEVAQQDDSNNPGTHIDAAYLRGDFGVSFSFVTIEAGYEKLGGSPEDGQFRTPLATLHKFNGWADKFLSTPTDGLQDLSLSFTAGLGAWKLMAIFHDFSAATGGGDWGTELDGAVIYTTPWKQQAALKLARYNAEDFASDTTKVWVWTSWGF